MTSSSINLPQGNVAAVGGATGAKRTAPPVAGGQNRTTRADTALRVAARTWFVVAAIGQWVFLSYLLAFYAPSTLTGNFQLWAKNPLLMTGYVAGDTAGNLAFAAHALMAAVIAFGGALQIIPRLRKAAPKFHRWNGRLFMLTALFLSCTGLYMVWFRGTPTLSAQNLAITLNAVLIIAFGGLSWRSALRRDMASHQRWALRTYLVSNAQWFTRVGLFAWIILNQGPVGMGANFDGPVVIFWAFGCYLVPLAVLELYLRTKDSHAARRKFAMAATLFVSAALAGVGTVGVSMFAWIPAVKAVNDRRIPIADTLSVTILSSGIGPAVKQYRELKAAAPTRYNFDEKELRRLGRQLIAGKRFGDGIAILRLNLEAYPQSAKANASLAAAYMEAGNRSDAIFYCRQALKLNPGEGAAQQMLLQLGASAPPAAEKAR